MENYNIKSINCILFLTNSHQISPRPPRVVSLHKKTDGEAPSARLRTLRNSEDSDLSQLSTLNSKPSTLLPFLPHPNKKRRALQTRL